MPHSKRFWQVVANEGSSRHTSNPRPELQATCCTTAGKLCRRAQLASALNGRCGGAATTMKIRNSRVQRQKPLCPFNLPKPQLTPFLTSSRSMGLLHQIVAPRLKSPADDAPPRAQVIRGSPPRNSRACRCKPFLGPHTRPASARRSSWLRRCPGVAEATHPAQLRVRLQRATASGNAAHEHMHFVQMPP
jgi:hypothetical protein